MQLRLEEEIAHQWSVMVIAVFGSVAWVVTLMTLR